MEVHQGGREREEREMSKDIAKRMTKRKCGVGEGSG